MSTLLHSEEDKQALKEKRVPFWLLVSMLDDGITEEQILKKYPFTFNC